MALASSMRWRFWTKAAERVKIDALVLVVVVIIVGGGGGSDGGSQRGPRRCIFLSRLLLLPRHPLSSDGGAGIHEHNGPRDRGQGAVAVAVDGGGAAASRRLVL